MLVVLRMIIVIVVFKVILLLKQVQQIVLPKVFLSPCVQKVLSHRLSPFVIVELTLQEKQTITVAQKLLMLS